MIITKIFCVYVSIFCKYFSWDKTKNKEDKWVYTLEVYDSTTVTTYEFLSESDKKEVPNIKGVKVYNIYDINVALFEHGEQLLGMKTA